MLWCLWLMGSWMTVLWMDPSVPAARWMVLALVTGLMLVWPAMRLAESPDPRLTGTDAAAYARFGASLGVLMEWLLLIVIAQVVIWPLKTNLQFWALRQVRQWTVQQVIMLDIAIATWSLLTALILAVGILQPRAISRSLAMLGCIAVILFAPLLQLFMPDIPVAAISPIHTIWELAGKPIDQPFAQWGLPIAVVAGVTIVAWVSLIMIVRKPSPNQHADAP